MSQKVYLMVYPLGSIIQCVLGEKCVLHKCLPLFPKGVHISEATSPTEEQCKGSCRGDSPSPPLSGCATQGSTTCDLIFQILRLPICKMGSRHPHLRFQESNETTYVNIQKSRGSSLHTVWESKSGSLPVL